MQTTSCFPPCGRICLLKALGRTLAPWRGKKKTHKNDWVHGSFGFHLHLLSGRGMACGCRSGRTRRLRETCWQAERVWREGLEGASAPRLRFVECVRQRGPSLINTPYMNRTVHTKIWITYVLPWWQFTNLLLVESFACVTLFCVFYLAYKWHIKHHIVT